ncbi:hypothetical protein KH5H1_55410 [Corallococcus caeni]|uniref:COR domain-containing protein n=1 Tax=Corallococcus caeni TaxID=3082388 RepID=UPI002957F57F|nr:hypothetical protein KH5H1_55410 [Corallococcus sp. KH5-1]
MNKNNSSNEAFRRIEAAIRGGGKKLELSWLGLDEMLEEIRHQARLSSVEEIDLLGNHLRGLPGWLGELKGLRSIDIRRNPIGRVNSRPGMTIDWDVYVENKDSIEPEHIRGFRLGSRFKTAVDEIGNFPNLEIVDFGQDGPNNDFDSEEMERAIDVVVEALPGLKELELLHVGLRRVPKSIAKLSKLESLDISSNPIEILPAYLVHLEGLRTLSFADTAAAYIPDWVFELSRLEVLQAGYNGIRTIPKAIGRLAKLRSLFVNDNHLSDLPASIAGLSALEWIYLSYNLFKKIPDVLFDVGSLERIAFNAASGERTVYWAAGDIPITGVKRRRGRIREVGVGILRLQRLASLTLEEQPIQTPPEEVVAQGVDAIKNYWRQRNEAGTDYLCEAKLIIVGEPGAGKTSLANKIVNSDYRLRTEEKSTEGIDVLHWGFPVNLIPKGSSPSAVVLRNFNVNVWDFGGQEIYHATHQFFLTRRSVYVLVADGRREDTDFYYWLSVVELLSEGSPIIVVMNEKQDRQRDIDETGLRGRFANLREVLVTNLASNRGLDEIRRVVRSHLERLPHIGEALPATWRRVREVLERDSRNYISLADYLRVCEENGFTRHEDKIQLSGYLHDLGICVHFQDDPILKGIVILKPKWGTDAVYRVLDDANVLSRKGRFSSTRLDEIWSEPEYALVRDELLQLMVRFGLCYRLEEGDVYIAPQLLGTAVPDYSWPRMDGIALRYVYDFMPKGIVTRLIVGLNRLIADQGLVWRSGVVLEREGSRCEIVEDYVRRQISVRAVGAYSRELLAIVDNELARIHKSFRRLRWRALVPCRCDVCRQGASPEMYGVDVLRRFARDGRSIQCQLSYEMVDAGRLIEHSFPVYRELSTIDQIKESGGLVVAQLSGSSSELVVKQVFVSYAWGGESGAVVDDIERIFGSGGVRLLRDKNEVGYRDSIRKFMQRLGRGRCVVVVLSRGYLESKSCMFELMEIASANGFRERVFPVVLPDANIFNAIGVLDYVKHWEVKIHELDGRMKEVESSDLDWIRDEIDLYRRIRSFVAKITGVLRDMNARSLDVHRSEGYREILAAVELSAVDKRDD